MNKTIKNRKKDKLNFKKVFTKEERLFIKQYPRLCFICFKEGISRLEIKRAFAKEERELDYYKSVTKEYRELLYRGAIANDARGILIGLNK
ncbi:hypothetical protein ACV3R5_10755 [Clostridium perfringens]|uniref:Uncharacterized protein n=1 Tax=Clostridium perfringens TaxID=1502 RepID=A0A133MQ47_CLOPF|nr:hypothetical protein [Clostridium perfringens]ELU5587481.1 hypothetical protein [Clostridium perfringens]KXA06155.1 hypothetical protein HMPREF3222_02915 [Clostridium perfringens]